MKSKDLERYGKLRYENDRIDESGSTDIDVIFRLTGLDSAPVDVDRAWDTFQSRVNSEKKSARIISLQTVYRIAASIVIILSLGITYLYINNGYLDPTYVSFECDDAKKEILLPDGSTVVLNADSKISYKSQFGKRIVEFEGEAYFDIKKDDRPFRIKTSTATVRVLGTAFSVKAINRKVKVYVERGKVALAMKDRNIEIEPGQSGVYKNNKLILRRNGNPNDIAWMTGKFSFENESLKTVTELLSEYYSTDIILTPRKLSNCKVTGSFEGQGLGEILKIIGIALDIKVIEQSNSIILEGKGC